VKPGGLLIITCPNFRGIFFRIYHAIWDRYSYKKHYLPVMKPSIWKELLEDNGFRINYSGYFGGFYFWNEERDKRRAKKIAPKLYLVLADFVYRIIPIGIRIRIPILFNCFCGIVAIKNETLK
jgi:hypothetical protein